MKKAKQGLLRGRKKEIRREAQAYLFQMYWSKKKKKKNNPVIGSISNSTFIDLFTVLTSETSLSWYNLGTISLI